ncbi:type I-C CRISPR-associated protein Cas7/Csd2 [Geomicrobium sp. JCM 19039]|uniref:type I-C CRISPR-associated protein Cas7/Csd2 n=1 Tax=Geomicrobium sp. JCM 19039 TaxID=1460636 RepID=UPI00045F4621|nr:type I-C CRISPR-associated protein Cas7/Csd2 [Geomicrobium sp. JCM 19039]GAK11819.1 CRISPR-associated protein, Csd2 family [Geomicrobium sp. JCM 19039]
MKTLDKKIDFAVVISVTKANPNGDPLNGNRPRQNYEGYGEISDVAIKRKIRNRLQDMGQSVFVQSEDRKDDGFRSLKDRAESDEKLAGMLKDNKASVDEFSIIACENWIDVRSFGQVFAFKNSKISVGVRGPVSVHTAMSIDPVNIVSTQITKSVNSVTGDKKGEDTMGMKHRVDFGVYLFKGSINTQLSEKTGFTYEDAEKIKQALVTLFENDTSSARPDGSMEVHNVYWWEHSSALGQYSSAKVHRSLQIKAKTDTPTAFDEDNYAVELHELEGLTPEVLHGQ